MPTSSEPGATLVTFRGGFVADWQLVERLLEIEARGAVFDLVDGGRFRVVPGHVLTEGDRVLSAQASRPGEGVYRVRFARAADVRTPVTRVGNCRTRELELQ
jgi:hypothetical protein